MNVENPAALRFIMQDDIYLLNKDKTIAQATVQPPVAQAPAEPLPVAPVLQTPAVQAPVVQTQQVSFNYLGGNKKNLLILTYYTDEQFIAAEHLTALESILKRKDHAIDDIAIFNMAGQADKHIKQLAAHFKPVKVLVLGAKALPAGLEVLMLNQVKQGATFSALYSFSFDEMMGSTDNKKAFWDQMKNL